MGWILQTNSAKGVNAWHTGDSYQPKRGCRALHVLMACCLPRAGASCLASTAIVVVPVAIVVATADGLVCERLSKMGRPCVLVLSESERLGPNGVPCKCNNQPATLLPRVSC
jgi:hypothetical protein